MISALIIILDICCQCPGGGQELMTYAQYILPQMNHARTSKLFSQIQTQTVSPGARQFKQSNSRNTNEQYGQDENLDQLVDDVLNSLEFHGGPDVLERIRFWIPTYQSRIHQFNG